MSSVYAVLWYICQEQLLAFSESRKLNGGTKRFPLSVNNLYYFIIFCKCPQFSFLLFLFTSLLFCPLHLVEGQFPIDSFSLSHFQQLLSASILVLVHSSILTVRGRTLGGLRSMGSKELVMTEHAHTHLFTLAMLQILFLSC